MVIRPDELVLVGVVPHPRDLDIARLLGWYRIPLRTAPKVIAVDHVAFYQPGSFTGAANRIQYTAAVRGHELVTRADLLREQQDHPRASEEYYKLVLGPLEALPRHIPAGRWKRLTFLYTTGSLLAAARNLDELVVEGAERQALWHALRERVAGDALYSAATTENTFSGVELAALLGFNDLIYEEDSGKE